MAAAKLGVITLALASAAAGGEVARPAASFLFSPMDERAAAFSPDGNSVVFSLRIGDYRQVLMAVERRGGRWGNPEVAPFSGTAFDGTPSFSPDGKRLYFSSDRSPAGGSKDDFDIWSVAKNGQGWSAPEPVRGKVNTPGNETGPLLTRSGTLYFVSSKSGSGDIYAAKQVRGAFGEPHSVGAGVNSAYPEGGPAITPDENLMVFASGGRPDQPLAKGFPYPRSDLYVSRRVHGRWTSARRLGRPINSHAAESAPSFSADGRWFYFMSEQGFATDQQVLLTPRALQRGLAGGRNGLGNIFVVPAAAVERQ